MFRLWFPFLIGTVRTSNLEFVTPDDFVSIPHRYGKNEELPNTLLTLKKVSIPHRYGKN